MGDPLTHLDLLIHNAIAKHPYMAQALQMSHQVLIDEYRSMEHGFSAPPWGGAPSQQRETQDQPCLPPLSEETIKVYELLHKIIIAFSTLPQDEETSKESYETILSLFMNKKYIDRFIQFFSESRFVAFPPDFKEMVERSFPSIWTRLERVDPEKKINFLDRMPHKEAFSYLRNLMDAIQPEFVPGDAAQGAQHSDAPTPMMNPFLLFQPVMRTPQQQLFDMGQLQQNIFSNGLPYAMAFMQGMMSQGPAPSFAAPMFNPLPRPATVMPHPSHIQSRAASIAPNVLSGRVQMGQHFDPDSPPTARDPSRERLFGGVSPWLRNDWDGSRDNKNHNWSGGSRWESNENSTLESAQRSGEEGIGGGGEGVQSSFESSGLRLKQEQMGSGIPPRPIKKDPGEFRRPTTPSTSSSVRSSRSQTSIDGSESSINRQRKMDKPVASGVNVKNENYALLPSGDPSDPAPLFSAAIPDYDFSLAPRRSSRQAAKQREMEKDALTKPKRSRTVVHNSKNDVKVDVKELKRFASVQGRVAQLEPDDLQSDVVFLPSTDVKKIVKLERSRSTQTKSTRKRVIYFSVDENDSKFRSEEDRGKTKKSKASNTDASVVGVNDSSVEEKQGGRSSLSQDPFLAPSPRRPGLRQRGRTVDYRMKHLTSSSVTGGTRGRASSGCEEPPGLADASSSSGIDVIFEKERRVNRGQKALPTSSSEDVKVEMDEISPDAEQVQNREEDNIFLSIREDTKEEDEEPSLLTIQQGRENFNDQPLLSVPVKKEVYDSRKEASHPMDVQRTSRISLVSLTSEAINQHWENHNFQQTTGGEQELKAESLLREDTDCYWNNEVEGPDEYCDDGEFQQFDEETIRNMPYVPGFSHSGETLVPLPEKEQFIRKSMSDPLANMGKENGTQKEVAKTMKVSAPFIQPYRFSSVEGKDAEDVEQAGDHGEAKDPDFSVPEKKIKMTTSQQVSEGRKEPSNERLKLDGMHEENEEKPPVMDEEGTEKAMPPEKKVRFSQVIQINKGGQENEEDEVKREPEEDGGQKEKAPFDDGRIDEMEDGEIRTSDDEDYKPEVEKKPPRRRSASSSRHRHDHHRSSSSSRRKEGRSRRESSIESVREEHRYRFRSNSTARSGTVSRTRGSTVGSSQAPSFSQVRIALYVFSDAKMIRMPRIPEPYYLRDTDTICPTFQCAAVLYISRDESILKKTLLIPNDLPRAFIVCALGVKPKLHLPAEKKQRPDSLLRNAFALLAMRLR